MIASSPRAVAPEAIVFFDGECPLCNRSIAFLARNDPGQHLFYAHLQGAFAESNLDPTQRNAARDGTVVLLEPDEGGRVSVRSAAILRSLAWTSPRRRFLARLADSSALVRILDVLYAFVARHRDAWFGRHDTCALPDPSFRARFLE